MVRVTEEQKQIIRNSILEVSKKHFLEKGFDETKTKDIAKEVGIAEGTLFNYFDTKTEIFLASMAEGYMIDQSGLSQVDYTDEMVDILYELIYRPTKTFLKVPRKIIKEIATAGVSIAQKKPNLIKKIIQLDYDMIADLEKAIKQFMDDGRLKRSDEKMFANMIYSFAVVEMVMYVYEEKISASEMFENIRNKIALLIEGHTVGTA